jgi:hypothetical protein
MEVSKMRTLIRWLFHWLSAFFWSRRFRITSVIASSFALQAFACTYGSPDEPCRSDCYDPSLDCKPKYDYEKLSGNDYSECELSLAESLKYMSECKGSTPCKNSKAEPEDWLITATEPTWVCLDEKPSDCSYETLNAKQMFADSVEWNCSLDHLKSDSSLVGYLCGSNETVSVEEGERRRQEYKEWLDRQRNL